MKALPVVLSSLLFMSAASAQLPFQQPAAQGQRDAVAVDPATHHVLFENEFVRVFRALASPGRASPMHTHPPTVLVSLDRARFQQSFPDGTTAMYDFHPGEVVWLDGFEHAWEMHSGEAHIIGVELKAAAPESPPALPASDALAVDPAHHQVVIDNDHVRVFEASAEPGSTSPMHSHPPLVLISLGTARMAMRQGDGTEMLHDFMPGQVLWIGGEHSWEVLAGRPHVIAVEVKAARQAPAQP